MIVFIEQKFPGAHGGAEVFTIELVESSTPNPYALNAVYRINGRTVTREAFVDALSLQRGA